MGDGLIYWKKNLQFRKWRHSHYSLTKNLCKTLTKSPIPKKVLKFDYLPFTYTFLSAQIYLSNLRYIYLSKPISEASQYDLLTNTEHRVVFPRWLWIGFKITRMLRKVTRMLRKVTRILWKVTEGYGNVPKGYGNVTEGCVIFLRL